MPTSIFDRIDPLALIQSTSQCVHCEACIDACCTAEASDSILMNPMARLAISDRVLRGYTPLPEETSSLYHCTECGRCDTLCTQEIHISQTIADTKVMLVKKGLGPLEKHNQMTAAILKNRNAVGKPADERLSWVPDHLKDTIKFEDAPGETLLYVGCLSSYVDKASAAASLEILVAAGEDVKLLRDEYCCGIYPYNAGKWEEAEQIFKEMAETFKASGIKRIIVPCAGCHRAFSTYYPRLLKEFHIEVVHIAEVIETLIGEGRLKLNKSGKRATIHDSCKMGRKYGLYNTPRAILDACGIDISELPDHRENALCCGSGSGVRSINASLSMAIAGKVLSSSVEETIVSTCPFCIFNMNYTARKTGTSKKAIHIASLVRHHI